MMQGHDKEDDYLLSDQIGYLLRLANQRHLEIFHQHLPELTPTQFALLVTLSNVGEESQNELGRQIGIDAATTNGVIERLLKKALITTRTDPNDKRRLRISLSDDGQCLISECLPVARTISSRTLDGLTEREAQRLMQLLRKIQLEK